MKLFFLLLLLAAGARAAAPSCPPGAPAAWCDPSMVHLRISDASGHMEVRQKNETTTQWARPTWKESLVVSVRRVPHSKLAIEVRRQGAPDSSPPLKAESLRHGEALVLTCGRELPVGFAGKDGQTITFKDEETAQ